MKLDTSLTITSIIAFVALISPVLTAIINNRYQIKMKQLEINEKRYNENIRLKKELFEKYCESLSQVVVYYSPSYEVLKWYGSCYGKALLYMNKQQSDQAIEINKQINLQRYKMAHDLSDQHILDIKEQIDKLSTIPK